MSLPEVLVGRDLGLVRLKGDVTRDPEHNVKITLSTAEIEQLAKFSDLSHVTRRDGAGLVFAKVSALRRTCGHSTACQIFQASRDRAA